MTEIYTAIIEHDSMPGLTRPYSVKCIHDSEHLATFFFAETPQASECARAWIDNDFSFNFWGSVTGI